MKNTGLPYETLTMQIFNAFLNQNEVENIKLKHNITLQGKTTTHQIDIYWEFELANDIKYSTIIQAKDQKSKINKGQMLAFSAVLNDLPNQPRGVFVTRTGYQKGAKEVADSNGIQLYTLAEPEESFWDGSIKTVSFHMTAYVPGMKDFKPIADKEWIEQECEKKGIPSDQYISYSGNTENIFLADKHFKRLCSLADLINNYHSLFQEEFVEKEVREMFKEETFLEANFDNFKYVKLKGLVITLTRKAYKNDFSVDLTDLVGYILKNLSRDKEHIFDKGYNLKKKENE
ncbi:restriction endonuclease [Saccharibacillus endophyticus]|uniref:Restriction endonuclease type IV Mrr domain-containing protein n=1 Tax=Saccharibacillus endophyticus TaxID=2060666 RepID=A0ABQ1ZXE4_9BACL|nr:restriction endonuclease [Saccharibacillus endophyticus]GGH81776.1 hypothetical protein GCM10007362_32090 [Saccharibacillus endophyticus]